MNPHEKAQVLRELERMEELTKRMATDLGELFTLSDGLMNQLEGKDDVAPVRRRVTLIYSHVLIARDAVVNNGSIAAIALNVFKAMKGAGS